MTEEVRSTSDQVAETHTDSGGPFSAITVLGGGAGVAGPASSTSASGGMSEGPAMAERLLVMQRDRRCPRFSGRTGIGITEWLEEAQICIRMHRLTGEDQAFFLFDHLEGEAREEIKHRPLTERNDPAKISDILLQLYGCKESYVTLQQAFFSREQQVGETLLQYSLALMALMEKVKLSAPPGLLNFEVMLRDQFMEHVSDGALRRELKQFVRRNATATLLEVRGEAMRWEIDGHPGSAGGHQGSLSLVHGLQDGVRGRSQIGPRVNEHESKLDTLMELVKNQQEQINQLTKAVAAMQVQPPSMGPARPSQLGRCFRCDQPGHFARECREILSRDRTTASINAAVARPSSSTAQENCHPLN